jgi:hypothetical protein
MRLVSMPAATSEAAPRPEIDCLIRESGEAGIASTIATSVVENRILQAGASHFATEEKPRQLPELSTISRRDESRSTEPLPSYTTDDCAGAGRYLIMRISDQS